MAKRKHLTLSDQAKILEDLRNGVGVTVLSKKYGIAKSTICAIRTRRDRILKRVNNTFTGPGKMKTLRRSECPKMEKALYKWFLKEREKNLPVTGLMIQEKAKLLHSKYKESPSFNASSGWLQKYKKRFGIRYLKISGEKLSSQPELVDPFKRTLHLKINELQLSKEQIYNADETALYWKLLPGKTYVTYQEKTAPGRKTEKQRVTFLACANAAGTHKIKPLIIGKAKNPRSFRNFNCPVHYKNSKTAWMTAAIFKEWFHKIFIPEVTEFLSSQNLPIKAMLLLDNAASHPPTEQLRSDDGSIFTVYMPPNVTPLIQPMDQNAIRLTKLYYRKNLLSQIIGTNQDIGEALKSISLKDAVLNLALAWKNLKPEVVEKCWHNLLLPLPNKVDDEEDDIPLSILRSRIRNDETDTVRSEIVTLLHTFNPEVDIQPIDVDEWNKDNLPDTKETEDQSESDENDQDIREEVAVSKERVTTHSAIKCINDILQWAEENEDKVEYSSLLVLHDLRNTMVQTGLNKQKMQTKITSFFEKKKD